MQKTGDGANEKGAVTAKLSWQNDVNAAVGGAWQLPPFSKYPVVVPSYMMGPKAFRTSIITKECEKLQPGDEKCAIHFESPAELGVHRKEVLLSCDGCTRNIQRKATCNCDIGANLYNRFGSNGAS